MPLILAVNPAGIQSPTLARLARELKGCDLIGAESYAVAIQALDQHGPDLVLLSGTDAKGEAELMARLSAVPVRIPTLKLPPAAGLDFNALLADVKALLAPPAHVPAIVETGASPQLLAAATAAIEWVRARRSLWAFDEAQANAFDAAPSRSYEPDAPPPIPDEPAGPSVFSRAADAAGAWRAAGVAWLPRVAALVLLMALVSAAVFYRSNIRATAMSALTAFGTRMQPAGRVEPAASPAATAPRPGRSNDPPAGDGRRVSGWLAVFSPFDLSISEGNRPIALDDRSRVLLPPGPHKLRFRNKTIGYDEVRTVQIRSTETTTLNLIPQTTLSVTASEPAEVLIDGSPAGQTPLADRRVDVGTHTVMVKSSTGQREFTLEATTKPLQLDVDFSKP